MGCWNGTCAVSNLHIHAGQEVAVFMLLENKESRSFCYGNALYDICPIPFYGEYNDYGAVENCHGFGLNIVVDAIRDQLYEFGQGPNEYHDCVVNKSIFDLELLFEADHEDRLGIQHLRRWESDSHDLSESEHQRDEKGPLTDAQQFELNRLVAKIKQEDTFRRVTHVIIHGDIFKSIMEKWYIEDYVGAGKGTSGYDNNYNRVYFKDIEASIAEYVKQKKEKHEEIKKMMLSMGSHPFAPGLRQTLYSDDFNYNEPCLAIKWMRSFIRGEAMTFGLINVDECVHGYIQEEDWNGLASFAKEALTSAWVNSFMSHTRKVWTKQSGAGSQSDNPLGYQILAQSTMDILAAEKAEYDLENGEDDA